MPKVLIVATSRKTRGGITSVIKAHETGEQWKKFHCHWVQTHRDGPTWRKILYLLGSYVDFCLRIPFYDIAHFHISLQSTVKRKYPLFLLAKLFKKKTIVHLHCGTQIDAIWNNTYDNFFKKADLSLVLSNSLKDKIIKRLGLSVPVKVLYNPCPNISLRESKKENIILFSGTVCKGKGYEDLIKAFSCVAKKYPDWKVVIAGNGEIEEGRAIAKELGIENQVEFLGWVSGESKDEAFRKASVFCLPSYAEGFPMAVLDAWAYGLPVITTPVGGIPDVAEDGKNMLLFDPGDTIQLSKCLDRIISDKPLRHKISASSLAFAKGKFNIKTINRQLEETYNSLK